MTKTVSIILPFVFVAIFGMLFIASQVRANPSQIIETKSASATSTIAFMSPGAATTTVIMDAQDDGGAIADLAAFAIQFTGSSTLSIINIAFEYAHDVNGLDCVNNPNKCDWYADELNFPNASTTPSTIPLNTARLYSLTFASSTLGGGAIAASSTRTSRIINVPTPSRYVRAVITVPIGSLNGAVWSEFLRKREQR